MESGSDFWERDEATPPRSWREWPLRRLLAASLAGLLLSLSAHLADLLGALDGSEAVAFALTFALMFGLFILWIPASRLTWLRTNGIPRDRSWSVWFGGMPRWVYVCTGALLLYVAVASITHQLTGMRDAFRYGGASFAFISAFYAVCSGILYSAVLAVSRRA